MKTGNQTNKLIKKQLAASLVQLLPEKTSDEKLKYTDKNQFTQTENPHKVIGYQYQRTAVVLIFSHVSTDY